MSAKTIFQSSKKVLNVWTYTTKVPPFEKLGQQSGSVWSDNKRLANTTTI